MRTKKKGSQPVKAEDRANINKPVAMIMAGYNKVDFKTKRMLKREIKAAYDGDEIYIGKNKFLLPIAGKPLIQYVIDAVYNTKKNNERLYDKIYVYNDVESFCENIDVSQYPNLVVRQMGHSVGGHWQDFYFNFIDYGQRVDIFFGDVPRITPEDVLYVHNEFEKILGKEKSFYGTLISMVYGLVEYSEMKNDNWLDHRIRFIKRGQNKGKLKSFVGFSNGPIRIGNCAGMIKDPSMDFIIKNDIMNFTYNLRKALTPSVFSKMVYYLWKTEHIDMVRQIKNKCIDEKEFVITILDVFTKLYKHDFSDFGYSYFRLKKNAARWENDLDGPRDYEIFKKNMAGDR